MRLHAFQGIRFGGSAEEAGRLAAPPYDQIGRRLRDQLHARSPHHFTRLSRPVGDDGDAYAHAATLHRRWLEEGILEVDPEPALYPSVIELATGAKRLGLTALVGLEKPGSRGIQPHEATLEKPLADRLRLLHAMRIDLEPILLLADDEGALDRLLAEDLPDLRALTDYRDAAGNRHLLYRLDDPRRIAAYRQELAGARGLIADGHHRYKVAQIFAGETAAAPGTPAAAKLAVVTSLASPALTIDPIHRASRRAADPAAMRGAAVARTPWEGSSGAELAAAVAAAEPPAIGVWAAGSPPEVWRLDPERGPDDLPAAASRLPVVLLHRTLLPLAGLPESAASDGTIAYRDSPEELARMVAEGEARAGFWLPPMAPEEFAAAIAGGDLLPPKSTRFLPKLASGLVWAGHDSRLD
jgi:uncharacterized protein (DUF1015 family)